MQPTASPHLDEQLAAAGIVRTVPGAPYTIAPDRIVAMEQVKNQVRKDAHRLRLQQWGALFLQRFQNVHIPSAAIRDATVVEYTRFDVSPYAFVGPLLHFCLTGHVLSSRRLWTSSCSGTRQMCLLLLLGLPSWRGCCSWCPHSVQTPRCVNGLSTT